MPRLVNDESGINLLVWLQALCDFETDTRTPHGWHEFSLGFNLVLLGLIIYQFKNIENGKKWLLLFIPVFWLGLGNMPPYFNPWYILNHYVPIFTSLRAPYRFGILTVFVMYIAILKTYKFTHDNRLLYMILTTIVLTQTLSFNAISKKLTGSKRIEEISVIKKENPQGVKIPSHAKFSQYVYIRENQLVQNAYEPLYLAPVTDSSEQFLRGAKLVSFTPNKITLKADSSDVNVSLRYSANWHLQGQGDLHDINGLLHIAHAGGSIQLVYKNNDFQDGWIASAISLTVLLVILLLIKLKGTRTTDQ